jgi:tRNA threonylcarbamoyladenosine biosynthesis protein TsaE
MLELVTNSPEETERVGARLAARLRTGDVVGVGGELGTGKTTFIRGACRALGVVQPVTSPTYTLGNRYEADPPVSHIDLYRLDRVSEADWGGLEPYFEGAITFVEWYERGEGALPPPRVTVRLSHLGATRRGLEIESSEAALLTGLR